MRILLVEDDRSLSRAVSTILQKNNYSCLLYTSPSPRDAHETRMPSSA